MKETLRKIDIITLCLVIIVVNLAYCYAQLKVFDKDYVNFFGYTIFQVITGSMEDTIKINDIVLVTLYLAKLVTNTKVTPTIKTTITLIIIFLLLLTLSNFSNTHPIKY